MFFFLQNVLNFDAHPHYLLSSMLKPDFTDVY